MSEASLRSVYCGPNGTPLERTIARSVLRGEHRLSDLAYAQFRFECSRCNNRDPQCIAVFVNGNSNGTVIPYLLPILDKAVRAAPRAQLELLMAALARSSPCTLFHAMARFPLRIAPLFRELEHDLAHQDMTYQSQLHLIASGVCNRDIAAVFLRPIRSNRDPDVKDATAARAVQSWSRWVTCKGTALPLGWRRMLSASLHVVTPIPIELCVYICDYFA